MNSNWERQETGEWECFQAPYPTTKDWKIIQRVVEMMVVEYPVLTGECPTLPQGHHLTVRTVVDQLVQV
jgi:hypothetical protein